MRLLVGVSSLLIFCCSSRGDTTTALSRCAVHLKLPRVSPAIETAGLSGPIQALIEIGDGGAIRSIRLSGGEKEQRREIDAFLNESTFSARCNGQTLSIVFSFVIDKFTDSCRYVWVDFFGPNRFVFTIRRSNKAIID